MGRVLREKIITSTCRLGCGVFFLFLCAVVPASWCWYRTFYLFCSRECECVLGSLFSSSSSSYSSSEHPVIYVRSDSRGAARAIFLPTRVQLLLSSLVLIKSARVQRVCMCVRASFHEFELFFGGIRGGYRAIRFYLFFGLDWDHWGLLIDVSEVFRIWLRCFCWALIFINEVPKSFGLLN